MSNDIIERKWSSGEEYKKSARIRRIKEAYTQDELSNIAIDAQKQSLLTENDSWGLGPNFNDMNLDYTASNRRENVCIKMNEREMVCQRGMNPFMENNYINDISNQDIFLRPKNTTIEENDLKISKIV